MPSDHHPLDFLELDSALPPEARSARDAVQDWVRREFLPVAPQLWRRNEFPREFFEELGRLRVFGPTLSGWGCPGLNPHVGGVMMRELERGDTGLRTCASVQGSLAMTAIATFGSDAQKERLLPRMATGHHLGCFGLSEPDHGSNPGGMTTMAFRDGDHYVLRGGKKWIGNATVADTAVIWAKIDDADDDGDKPTPSSRAMRGFLVDTTSPGYEASLIEGRMSLRIGLTADIQLHDVRVHQDDMLPGARGLRGPLTCLDHARFGIAWGVIGSGMACLEEALAHTQHREVFDRPLASFQLAQDKLARMLIPLVQAQAVASRLATLKAEGSISTQQISLGKVGNVDAAITIARLGRELLGGVGILDDRVCFRHLSNLESVATYEGTRDIHHLILGEALTGLPAFR